MLYVLFADVEEVEGVYYYPRLDFDSMFENDWLNDPLAKRIIKEIDNSDHIKDGYIESPVLGAISPIDLSTSAKTLILIYKEGYITDLVNIGDNCVQLLIDISELRDVFCVCNNPYLSFSDVKNFICVCLNDNEIITDDLVFLKKMYHYIELPEAEQEKSIRRFLDERSC